MTVQNKTGIADRRTALRADRVVAVEHRLIKRHSRKISSSWSLSTTRNMSFSGMLFLSERDYKLGDVIEVNVVISGVIDIVKGSAQVVRVIESGDTCWEIAVRFIPVKPKARSAQARS